MPVAGCEKTTKKTCILLGENGDFRIKGSAIAWLKHPVVDLLNGKLYFDNYDTSVNLMIF